jgi:hypothetical protein
MKKFLAVFKARTMEFVRDRGTFFWNLIFPVLLVIGVSFAFSGDGESLFNVGILGAPEQTESSSLDPVRDFLSIPQIEFIYYPEDDRQELLGKLRGHQLDMILDAGEREPAKTGRRIRISCAPSAGLGAGGGAWKLVNSTRSQIWRKPWGLPNAMSAASCGSPIWRLRCLNA